MCTVCRFYFQKCDSSCPEAAVLKIVKTMNGQMEFCETNEYNEVIQHETDMVQPEALEVKTAIEVY